MKKLILLFCLLLTTSVFGNGESTSPNMGLVVPATGVTIGPDWANDLDQSLTIIDAHDHSPGHGVQVTPAGLNINSDLSCQDNNLTNPRSVRFYPQGSAISGGADVGAIYEFGVDLYYNDGNGNQIRLTQGGSIVGTPGSISGLVPPASASYVSGSSTFVFQSAVNTAANLDGGCLLQRDLTANSNAITLCPPSGLSSNYNLTWPASPPSVQSFMTMDSSGNIAAPWTPDNVTTQISSNTLQVIPSAGLALPAMIMAYGGVSAPAGWLLCDGTSYLISDYPNLAAALYDSSTGNYAYGSADSLHFNVPDFRGKFLRAVDGGAGYDPDTDTRTNVPGYTGGNTGDNVGSYEITAFDQHHHATNAAALGDLEGVQGGASFLVYSANGEAIVGDSPTGGLENRPFNVYVNYLIKY